MPKEKTDAPAAPIAPVDMDAQPPHGGAWVRQPDGSLVLQKPRVTPTPEPKQE